MSREVYDKIYLKDDYSEQFGALRDRYHDRTQQALKPRSVDEQPMPNATTVVWMKDTPDGGVTISTGDFVAFYNQRHGYDRVGEARRAIIDSTTRVELKRIREKHAAEQASRTAAPRKARKSLARLRFSFAYAALSMMLVLSLVMFFGTSAVLGNTVEEMKALESEVATLQSACGEDVVSANTDNTAPVAEISALDGTDSVEVYHPAEEEGFTVAALLNALASLGGK